MNKLSEVILAHVNGQAPAEYSNIEPAKREDAIRKAFLAEMGLETYSQREFRKAFRKNEIAIYEIIEEIIADDIKGIDGNPFFSQFCEVKNLDLGDTQEFFVEGANSLIVSEISGGNWNLKRQRVENGSAFMVYTKTYGVSVYDFVERVASGRCDFAKFIALVTEAVQLKIEELAHTTLLLSLSKLPAEFQVSGSYDEEAILGVCSKVQSVNQEEPILVGTKTALSKLQGRSLVAMSNEQLNERASKGYTTLWNSYTCVELTNNVKKGTFDEILSNNEIYVMSSNDKPIKVVLEGGEVVKENSGEEMVDRTMNLSVMFKAGVACAHSKVIGRITLA